MGFSFREWRRARLLRRARIEDGPWVRATASSAFLGRLEPSDLARLRDLTTLFLHEKSIHGAAGLDVTDTMRVTIAAQACLLILNLGLDSYSGWSEVIVYPAGFVPQMHWTDEDGVVHSGPEPRIGESWLGGPVVLSWDDVASARETGIHVVIHEFAHKLDMLNGDANGFPPLHAGMSRSAWSEAFRAAYDDLCHRVDHDEETPLDPYAAESAAEFFAVASEAFFEEPAQLDAAYPRVYAQLTQFYRQDPLRLSRARSAPAEASA